MKTDLSDFPTYQKCFDLCKDEDQAFRCFYWNAVVWHLNFKERLQAEDFLKVWVNAHDQSLIREILGDKE